MWCGVTLTLPPHQGSSAGDFFFGALLFEEVLGTVSEHVQHKLPLDLTFSGVLIENKYPDSNRSPKSRFLSLKRMSRAIDT